MKPEHRTIATKQWTRSAVTYHTKSRAMKKRMSRRRMSTPSFQKQRRRRLSPQALGNIVGCRIVHGWKEGDEPVTQWKAIVLDQCQQIPLSIWSSMTELTVSTHLNFTVMRGF